LIFAEDILLAHFFVLKRKEGGAVRSRGVLFVLLFVDRHKKIARSDQFAIATSHTHRHNPPEEIKHKDRQMTKTHSNNTKTFFSFKAIYCFLSLLLLLLLSKLGMS
jgi:hypothetical protein